MQKLPCPARGVQCTVHLPKVAIPSAPERFEFGPGGRVGVGAELGFGEIGARVWVGAGVVVGVGLELGLWLGLGLGLERSGDERRGDIELGGAGAVKGWREFRVGVVAKESWAWS